MEEREKIVKRIVEEKGESAIPILIELLFDNDPQTAEIASDALIELDSCDQLVKRLDKEIRSAERTLGIFYIADIIGEKKCKGAFENLKKLLDFVQDEREALIIHGALLKFGFKESEKYLLYELENDPYMEELVMDVAIELSSSNNPEVIKALSKKAEEHPELVDVIQIMCEREPSLFELLPENIREKIE
uniref:HEAT repeat domain-containing protein n=1 Tax=Mesoaciditoga lauensis TaxID=1495039 RepID=A0A7V3RDN1_9BACT